MSFYEHNKRSLIKSVTFRIAVLISDFFIITLITHRYDIALGMIIATNLASTTLYYIHERAWNGISWGKDEHV